MRELNLILDKTTDLLSTAIQQAPRGEVEQGIVHVQQILQETLCCCQKCREEALHSSCPDECDILKKNVVDAFGLGKA